MRRARKPALLASAIGVVALIAVGFWWRQWSHTPRVDRSTPLRQAGFELLEVQTVPPDCVSVFPGRVANARPANGMATEEPIARYAGGSGLGGTVGLWIRPVQPVKADEHGSPIGYQARVRTPDGRECRAECALVPATGAYAPGLIHVRPSPRWPSSFGYLDVSLRGPGPGEARWRITNLPRMIHALPPGTPIKTAVTVGGATVTGRAWRTSYGATSLMADDVMFDATCQGSTGPARRELGLGPLQLEWDTPGSGKGGVTCASDCDDKTPVRVAVMTPGGYPGHQRLAHLGGQVRDYDAVDEPVTFHGLRWEVVGNGEGRLIIPTAQTVTTPSGIKITLLARPRPESAFSKEPYLRLQMPSSVHSKDLPRSRLSKAHSGVYKVYIKRVTPPFYGGGISTGDGVKEIWLGPAPRKTVDIPSVTLVVRHRVEIASYPFQLTVPVQDGPPPDILAAEAKWRAERSEREQKAAQPARTGGRR